MVVMAALVAAITRHYVKRSVYWARALGAPLVRRGHEGAERAGSAKRAERTRAGGRGSTPRTTDIQKRRDVAQPFNGWAARATYRVGGRA